MKLLKIILIFFAIYFIRRLIQAWRVMKQIQEMNARNEFQGQEQEKGPTKPDDKAVDAEYKVID
jgi:flagellar biogenesis protein FliO